MASNNITCDCVENTNCVVIDDNTITPDNALKFRYVNEITGTSGNSTSALLTPGVTSIRLKVCGDGIIEFSDLCCFQNTNTIVLKIPLTVSKNKCFSYMLDVKKMDEEVSDLFVDEWSSTKYDKIIRISPHVDYIEPNYVIEQKELNLQLSAGYLFVKIKFDTSDIDDCKLKYRVRLNLPVYKLVQYCNNVSDVKEVEWALGFDKLDSDIAM